MTTTTTKLAELTGDYVLDPAHTRIGFVARHSIGPKVRGHFGEFEGSVQLDGDDPSRSSAELMIYARSLDTRNQRRDEHLRSNFLDTSNHSTITFTSTTVEQVDVTAFNVSGDLTIRGVTRPVTVAFALTGVGREPAGGLGVSFEGNVTVNRKDWGVNWNAATGLMVGEQVTLVFDIAAVRQS